MAFNSSPMPTAIANGLRRQQAAQAGGYGSIAARFAPDQYGSIASRQHPGLFGDMPLGGSENPDDVARQTQQLQQNQRTLEMRSQQFQLSNPSAAQQIYQNNQAMNLRRQNMFLNPPNLGLNGEDDEEQQPQY